MSLFLDKSKTVLCTPNTKGQMHERTKHKIIICVHFNLDFVAFGARDWRDRPILSCGSVPLILWNTKKKKNNTSTLLQTISHDCLEDPVQGKGNVWGGWHSLLQRIFKLPTPLTHETLQLCLAWLCADKEETITTPWRNIDSKVFLCLTGGAEQIICSYRVEKKTKIDSFFRDVFFFLASFWSLKKKKKWRAPWFWWQSWHLTERWRLVQEFFFF